MLPTVLAPPYKAPGSREGGVRQIFNSYKREDFGPAAMPGDARC